MKKLIRIITLVSVATIIFGMTGLLSGCTTGAGKNKAKGIYGGVDISKLKNTDITFVSHFDPGSKSDKNAFGKTVKWWQENTGGKVNLKIISAEIYPTKLMAMIGAGNAPEIIMVDQRGWMPRLAVLNVLQPVDEFIKKEDIMTS